MFLAKVRRVPLLTPAQEMRLARAASDGDVEARRELIVANLRLVIAIAGRYRGRGLPFLDLIQEGSIGLIEAVDRFDHRRGYRFSTYGAWLVDAAIKNAVRRKAHHIRLPERLVRILHEAKVAEAELTHELARAPSVNEISRASGLDRAEVERAMACATRPASLEALDASRGSNSHQDVDGPDDYEAVVLRQAVAAALRLLDQRERDVMQARFGFSCEPQTLQVIGDRLGLSHERVRQIQNTTLERLRAALGPVQS